MHAIANKRLCMQFWNCVNGSIVDRFCHRLLGWVGPMWHQLFAVVWVVLLRRSYAAPTVHWSGCVGPFGTNRLLSVGETVGSVLLAPTVRCGWFTVMDRWIVGMLDCNQYYLQNYQSEVWVLGRFRNLWFYSSFSEILMPEQGRHVDGEGKEGNISMRMPNGLMV